MRAKTLPLSEIALVLVCLDHVARFIVNTNYSIMSWAVECRVATAFVNSSRHSTGQPSL